jgi:predicted membrane-bound dolichyl-phosphate-mannose-protein mannosyltransferase
MTMLLAFLAALLALTAVAIRYFRDGEIRWTIVAAALFLLAFGYGARHRIPKS